MMKLKISTIFIFFAIYSVLLESSLFAQQLIIKVGTLAPVGSIWYDLLNTNVKNINAKVGDKVKVIIYPGGVMGDEEEMIKKIRIGQLHVGAFTINGIKKIAPELGVLDLPILFKNYNEIDKIIEIFYGDFERFFEKRGFKLLLFAEQGFVYFYSKREDVSGFRDLGKTRVWAWKGERVMTEIAKLVGTSPIFLAVPDVLSGLESGMIESFQTSPVACLSLQWCKLVKVILDFPYRYEPGVIVMYKKIWDELPSDVTKAFESEMIKAKQEYNPAIRRTQEEAKAKLKEMGVKFVKPQDVDWLEKEVKDKLWFSQDSGYPHDFLRKILDELEKLRTKK